jgi:hypothetical protein
MNVGIPNDIYDVAKEGASIFVISVQYECNSGAVKGAVMVVSTGFDTFKYTPHTKFCSPRRPHSALRASP